MKKIALVTGANRGLGFEVCRQLTEKGITPLLTARDEHLGKEAAEKLRASGAEVLMHQLDVSDEASIQRLKRYVDQELGGRVDILVNNAGMMDDDEERLFTISLDLIRKTFENNTLGAFRLCQLFVPGMMERRFGRVVNVSSGLGQLDEMGTGYPAYRLSKAALNAVTRMFAAEATGRNVLVNSASPGWTRTRMGTESAPTLVEEGADTLVWLATLPDDGPTGGFYEERDRIPW